METPVMLSLSNFIAKPEPQYAYIELAEIGEFIDILYASFFFDEVSLYSRKVIHVNLIR